METVVPFNDNLGRLSAFTMCVLRMRSWRECEDEFNAERPLVLFPSTSICIIFPEMSFPSLDVRIPISSFMPPFLFNTDILSNLVFIAECIAGTYI